MMLTRLILPRAFGHYSCTARGAILVGQEGGETKK